VGLPIN